MRVAAFYRFVPIADPPALVVQLREQTAELVGTLLVAPEGINGTVAGEPEVVRAFLAILESDPRFSGLPLRESDTPTAPFHRMKVRLKKEIVTLGAPVDPNARVGHYIPPSAWNEVLDQVPVIDMRNTYETSIGSFEGALDPQLDNFRSFPAWVDAHPEVLERPVAMFCTGGIRCEKASSYLLEQGCPEVLHLQGGILAYLEQVPQSESRWQGDCFVFDERVSVDHQLQATGELCRGCRRPLTEDSRARDFEQGVRCGDCGQVDEDTLTRRRERQKQHLLAIERGEKHIGRR